MNTTTTNPTNPTTSPSPTPAPQRTVLTGPINTTACTTFQKLEDALVQQVTHALMAFVQASHPLAQPGVSRILLKNDGSVVVERLATLPKDEWPRRWQRELELELFHGGGLAEPSSVFHHWTDDPDGPFVGPRSQFWLQRGALWYPVDPADPVVPAEWAVLEWRRFKLVALAQAEIVQRITSANYQDVLRYVLHRWLYSGQARRLLQNLNYASIKLSCVGEGRKTVTAFGGRRAFMRLYTEKAQARLREVLTLVSPSQAGN